MNHIYVVKQQQHPEDPHPLPTPSGDFERSERAKEAGTSAGGPGGQQMQMLAGPEPVLSLVAAVLTRDRANNHATRVLPAAGALCTCWWWCLRHLCLCLFFLHFSHPIFHVSFPSPFLSLKHSLNHSPFRFIIFLSLSFSRFIFYLFPIFSPSLLVFKSKESTQYTHTASDYIEVNASNIILSLTCQHMHI